MKPNPEEEAFLRQLGALAREEEEAAQAVEAQLEPASVFVERAFSTLAKSFEQERLRRRCWLRLQRSGYVAPMLLSAAATWLAHRSIWAPAQQHVDAAQRYSEIAASPRATYTLSLTDGALADPASQALCAGSTVSLLLRPTAPTRFPPRPRLDFDDGASSFACEAEARVEVDGSIALRLTLPRSAGRLRISLDSADQHLAALAPSMQTNQAWELPVSLDTPASAQLERTNTVRPRALQVKQSHTPYALTAD